MNIIRRYEAYWSERTGNLDVHEIGDHIREAQPMWLHGDSKVMIATGYGYSKEEAVNNCKENVRIANQRYEREAEITEINGM